MPHRPVSVFACFFILVLPAMTFATEVQVGIDPVEHLPPTGWDFGPVPIDGDFFGPGSDPFDGGIPGDQTSLDPTPDCPDAPDGTSMLMKRIDVALLPGVPSMDVVDVEIVEMSLVSSTPITVTYNGGLDPEPWDVEITLSATLPSVGTMTVRAESPEGGTFDSAILLQPYFTFTRVSDGEVRTLDGAGIYEDLISATDVPWVYEAPGLDCPSCTSNFIPGHDGSTTVQYAFDGTLSHHAVRSSCATTAIPSLSEWGLIVLPTMLIVALAYAIVRRRRLNMI